MYYVRNRLEEGTGGRVTGFAFNGFSKESLSSQHTKGQNKEV
jgi:hypothetical protein